MTGEGPQALAQWLHLTPTEIEALWLSLIVALWCVVICVPIAGLLGWVLARREFPGKAVLDVAVHLPLVLPPVATGYLLLLALGRQGWIGASLDNWFGLTFAFQWTGAVIASTVMALPLAVRAIRLALEAVPQELEISAASLGASRSQILWHVTLPLCLPGFAAAAILAFARSLGEFGATITFVSNIPGETQTIPNALYAVLQTPGGDAPAMRLMLISLGLAFAALLVSELLARRVRYHVGRAPRSGWSL